MRQLRRKLKTLSLINLVYLLDEQACRPYKYHFTQLIFQAKNDH